VNLYYIFIPCGAGQFFKICNNLSRSDATLFTAYLGSENVSSRFSDILFDIENLFNAEIVRMLCKYGLSYISVKQGYRCVAWVNKARV
jgi:hypothetical protein